MAIRTRSPRAAQIIANSAGAITLIGLVTLATWLVTTDDSFVQTALAVNAIAALVAIATWSGAIFRHKGVSQPESWGEWVGMFLLGCAMSALFLFIDCGHHLPQVLGGTECDGHPGISVVFTFAAIAMTTIALPSALRAWLLSVLASAASGGREA
jgi:hypothetical protein